MIQPNSKLEHLKNFESFNLIRVYHATSKDELKSLFAGIRINKADTWGQGLGFYVHTDISKLEEMTGVGSRFIDAIIEIEAEASPKNFDIDYEMNDYIAEELQKLKTDLIKKFNRQLQIEGKECNFLIFCNGINKDDFYLEDIQFKDTVVGQVVRCKKDVEWCYLPIQDKKIKIINNIYGAPLTKDIFDRLESCQLKDDLIANILKKPNPGALRYIGKEIKPIRYKLKQKNKWGEWFENSYLESQRIQESSSSDIEVKFVSKTDKNNWISVFKSRDGRITKIEKSPRVTLRFPFSEGQYLNMSVRDWACRRGYLIDGVNPCPEEKIFGIRKSDIPKGHELRMLYPGKFR